MNIDARGLKEAEIKKVQERAEQLRIELFRLRVNAATAHVKDYSQFGKLRKEIARALTALRALIADSEEDSSGRVS